MLSTGKRDSDSSSDSDSSFHSGEDRKQSGSIKSAKRTATQQAQYLLEQAQNSQHSFGANSYDNSSVTTTKSKNKNTVGFSNIPALPQDVTEFNDSQSIKSGTVKHKSGLYDVEVPAEDTNFLNGHDENGNYIGDGSEFSSKAQSQIHSQGQIQSQQQYDQQYQQDANLQLAHPDYNNTQNTQNNTPFSPQNTQQMTTPYTQPDNSDINNLDVALRRTSLDSHTSSLRSHESEAASIYSQQYLDVLYNANNTQQDANFAGESWWKYVTFYVVFLSCLY